MTIIIPVCAHDQELAEKNLAWAAELEDGKKMPLSAVLLAEIGTRLEPLVALTDKLFAKAQVHSYDPWEGSQNWPWPQNYAWKEAARLMQAGAEPWFWWEPDVTLLKPRALVELSAEYQRCGKPFMGHVVPNLVPGGHLNGAAFYPPNVARYSVAPLLAHDTPFDVVLSQGIRNQWHAVNHLMGHVLKSKERTGLHFVDQRHLESFFGRGSTLLCFHGCADGSLIDVLRGATASVPGTTAASGATTEAKPSGTNLKDLFSVKRFIAWIKRLEVPLIVHAVERHAQSSPEAERRTRYAFDSWCALYKSGKVKAAHLWDYDYPRDASVILDHRRLPFLKDVLVRGMNDCRTDDDMVMLTNDDTIIRASILPVLLEYMARNEAISSFRVNFSKGQVPSYLEAGPAQGWGSERSGQDLGRDLFCFRRRWLKDHWSKIPDFLLGECPWDLVLACLVRMTCSPPVNYTRENENLVVDPCELPRGYVMHETHSRSWVSPANMVSPGQKWNKDLTNQWASDWNVPALHQVINQMVGV